MKLQRKPQINPREKTEEVQKIETEKFVPDEGSYLEEGSVAQ